MRFLLLAFSSFLAALDLSSGAATTAASSPPFNHLHASAFRPGTAAQPFGWQSAIEDFDRDGDVRDVDHDDDPGDSLNVGSSFLPTPESAERISGPGAVYSSVSKQGRVA